MTLPSNVSSPIADPKGVVEAPQLNYSEINNSEDLEKLAVKLANDEVKRAQHQAGAKRKGNFTTCEYINPSFNENYNRYYADMVNMKNSK